ncbi:AHH domain-containing protein [Lacunimicrobium album]
MDENVWWQDDNDHSLGGYKIGRVDASNATEFALGSARAFSHEGNTPGYTTGPFSIDSEGYIFKNTEYGNILSWSDILNYEDFAYWEVSVIAVNNTANANATVIIHINDVNEAPTTADHSYSLVEGTYEMYELRTINARDQDFDDQYSLTYEILTEDAPFRIESRGGVGHLIVDGYLTTAHPAYNRTTGQLEIEYRVTDSDGLSANGTIYFVIHGTAYKHFDRHGRQVGDVIGRIEEPASNADVTFQFEHQLDGGNDPNAGRYTIDPQTGQIKLTQAAPYAFGESDLLNIVITTPEGGKIFSTVTVANESEEAGVEFEIGDFDPSSIPLSRIDTLLAEQGSLAINERMVVQYDDAVVVTTPLGHLVLKLVYRAETAYNPYTGGSTTYVPSHYQLVGVTPATFSRQSAADIFVNDPQTIAAQQTQLFVNEFLLGLLPGGATLDSYLQGNTTGAIRSGIADVLLTSLVFAKVFKAGATAVTTLAAMNGIYDAVDASIESYQLYQSLQQSGGQLSSGQGIHASVTLLRLMGVTVSASQIDMLGKLETFGKYRLEIEPSMIAPSGFASLAKIRMVANLTGSQAREILRKNLSASMSPTYPVAAQAHHIFPYVLRDSKLGKRLQSWGIDLNGVENGVFLPGADYAGRVAHKHTGRHLKTYTTFVIQELSKSKNKAEAIEKLEFIRELLLNGDARVRLQN